MEGFIVFIIFGFFVAGFLLFKKTNRDFTKNRVFIFFSKITEQLPELKAVKGEKFAYPILFGNIGDIYFSCQIMYETSDSNDIFYLNMNTRHNNNNTGRFSITTETAYGNFMGAIGVKDIKIGDEEFDKKMHISSSKPDFLMAFLSLEIRKNICNLTNYANVFKINERTVYLCIVFSEALQPSVFIEKIKAMVALSNVINNLVDIKEKLIKNIYEEQYYDIRAKIIDILFSDYDQDENVVKMLHKMLGDASLKIQVKAALNLDEEGLEHLLYITNYSRSLDDGLIQIVLNTYNERMYIKGIPVLLELFCLTDSESIKIKILKMLQSFKDKSACLFLVQELENPLPKIVVSAIEALGECGTKDTVETIYRKSKRSMNPFLRNAAQKAIAQIKSRITNADAGWLSMYELSEEEGKLSVSDEAGEGALSKDGE